MTEKNYNPQQKEKKAMKKQEVIKSSPNAVASLKNKIADANTNPHSDLHKEKKAMKKQEVAGKVKKAEKPVEALKKTEEKPTEVVKADEKKPETVKTEEKKKELKKEVPKVKKSEVSARGINLPISTKDAKFVCRFIVKKRIGDAIRDLEQVETGKEAVPMKGEIPHRKGKGIASGRFPKKAAKNFIVLLKSLAANANEGSLDEPIIAEAMANMAARPYGRFGRTQKKRTHVKIIAKDNIKQEKKDSKKSQASSAKHFVKRKEKKK